MAATQFETLEPGTAVRWSYRSGTGYGTILRLKKLGRTAASTAYDVKVTAPRPREPKVLTHYGRALSVISDRAGRRAQRARNAFGFGRRAAMSREDLQRQKESDARALCGSGQFRAADKLARRSVSSYARQKGVKLANPKTRRRNATLQQVDERKTKAVDFLRRVAGNEQADRLAAESPESYAQRKGIRIDNPRRPRRRNCASGPLSPEEILELFPEMFDYSSYTEFFPHATPADFADAKRAQQDAIAAAEAGKSVHSAPTAEGLSWRIVEQNPRGRGRRRNSAAADDELAEAGAAFERFQGRRPTDVLDVDTEVSAPPVLSKLGDLVSLTVLTLDGSKKKISFSQEDRVIAAQNPSGDQIYFVGGNQDVRPLLKDLGVDASKDLVELGQCVEIEYFTRKSLDNFQAVRYYHQFGEESGVIPTLAFDQPDLRLELIGGEYYIRPEGIRN